MSTSPKMKDALNILSTPGNRATVYGMIIDANRYHKGDIHARTLAALRDRGLVSRIGESLEFQINDEGLDAIGKPRIDAPATEGNAAKTEKIWYENAWQSITYEALNSYSEAQDLVDKGQEVIVYGGQRIGFVQVGMRPLNKKNIDPTLANFECVGVKMGIKFWRVQSSAGLIEIIGYPVKVLNKVKVK